MMEEKKLIGQIRELRQIKPNKDWVALTKSRILGEKKIELTPIFLSSVGHYLRLFFGWRPIYAGLIIVFVLFGLFGFAQNSLPGDPLYPIKKISERAQAVFVSEEEKPAFQLKLANERLEELAKIVEANQMKKLASAINEVQASIAQTSQNLREVKEPEKEKIAKTIVEQTQKLKGTKQKIEEVLATKIGTEESEKELEEALIPYYKIVAGSQIKDLEERTLTEEQEDILTQAKEDYEAGNYFDALIKILILSQPQK